MGIKIISMGLEADRSVPLKAEAPERFLKGRRKRGVGAVWVEVVDPEQPASAPTADVEVAAGRGQQ